MLINPTHVVAISFALCCGYTVYKKFFGLRAYLENYAHESRERWRSAEKLLEEAHLLNTLALQKVSSLEEDIQKIETKNRLKLEEYGLVSEKELAESIAAMERSYNLQKKAIQQRALRTYREQYIRNLLDCVAA